MKIKIIEADIGQLQVDAIVNPANSYGYMGGGIAGAIKKQGGHEIETEAIAFAPIPIGHAVLTTAGTLRSKHIIHSPTMEQPAAITDLATIKEATKAALECADENNLKKIAIPGMGTGVGRVPKEKAALAILETILNYEPTSVEEVILFDQDKEMVKAFDKAFNG
ncbi:MAG: macro domain-containing protein [Nanoarchaeota archaeon]|nr:macro domain-containing protein [Nanoarchaeota archaeon]MBU1705032.1 macro domain-containing protein [Nanoarchaeota archaeon]